MNRRHFLTASLSSLAAMAVPGTVAASSITEQTAVAGAVWTRRVFRLQNSRWVQCRMRDLVIGDRFRMEHEAERKADDRVIARVTESPTRDPREPHQDSGWEVMAETISYARRQGEV